MKKTIFFIKMIFVCSSLLWVASCCCKKKSVAASPAAITQTTVKKDTVLTAPTIDYVKEGFAKANIIYYKLDGCGYMLQLENGTKLEPTNLPEEFVKENLPVWVKYSHKKGGMSVCMAAPMVVITEIHLRK
jgi:hypothetical protein